MILLCQDIVDLLRLFLDQVLGDERLEDLLILRLAFDRIIVKLDGLQSSVGMLVLL